MTADYTVYEHDVMNYHRSSTGHKTWHWTQIPEEELFHAGYITDFNKYRLAKRLKKHRGGGHLQEFGLDGLSRFSNTYHGIQAKKYNGMITANKLGTFFSVIYQRLKVKNQDSTGYFYFEGKLQVDLKDDFQNSNSIFAIPFTPQPHSQIEIPETNFVLYEPQIHALNALVSGWDNVGYLSLPCGVGKTVVLGHFLKTCSFKSIVVVSPLRVLAKQTLERLCKFLPNHTPMLVDVDGDLDIDHIRQCLNGTSILSTTFKSYANVFSQLDMSGTLSIVDECHHLSHPGCDNQQFQIQNTIQASSKTLLMTGTPTAYMERHYSNLFSYPLLDAIRDDYICDYKIYLPEICEKSTELPIELETIDQSTLLILQSLFLVNGMLLYGSRRCIAYLSTIQECDDFNAALREVCDKYHTGVDVWTHSITANTPVKTRHDILTTFEHDTTDRLSIVSSVHVLDEGVNLKKCDSIFMNSVMNDTTFVQRLCRANRKDALHPNKVANCFYWENDREVATHVFHSLSKHDPLFKQKIQITRSNYDDTSEKCMLELESSNHDFINTLTIRILTNVDKWKENLDAVRTYMKDEKKRPSEISNDDVVRKLAKWIKNQQHHYVHKERIMKNETISQEWETFVKEFQQYFLSVNEKWYRNLDAVKTYMKDEKKRPSEKSKNDTIKKMGKWINDQQSNYANQKMIMKNDTIRKEWETFVKESQQYFVSDDEKWKKNLDAVKTYMSTEKKRPSQASKDDTIKKLAEWMNKQQQNYAKQEYRMKDESIRQEWETFVEEFQQYFKKRKHLDEPS